ncbi:MAG: 16S rRNA (cytosine(1402)-N(4))-methyltransferase RsmH [Ignavibacteriae bacterium HGW-Ignavibacteriae-3]|nr:MAG: 16S rRNA (cytosine(1402)-N(4))-methyltransferase RsmH [Ignavibacteriae bacterium HGW-Ignavibacteriae-3]
MNHEPVLLTESVGFLITAKDGIYLDATAGFGGHSEEILKKIDINGKLIATDKDKSAFDYCREKFSGDKRFSIYNTGFTNIDSISKIEFIDNFDGILADLGVSSYQLDTVESGFTFREDAPLDLRMNKGEGISASDLLNKFPQEEIAKILFELGEEKNSRIIARKIVEQRLTEKFSNTFQLKKIIEQVAPARFLNKSLSRVFQALRIFVNNELEELKIFLDKSISLLKPGGRIVVLGYHSLEDRIVKERMKYESLSCICAPGIPICVCGKVPRLKLITRKPVSPDDTEVGRNRRARSAKMRVAERV